MSKICFCLSVSVNLRVYFHKQLVKIIMNLEGKNAHLLWESSGNTTSSNFMNGNPLETSQM